MERGRTMETSKRKYIAGKRMKRAIAFALAAMMVINVPTPVEAFSLKGAFSKISSSVSNIKKSVQKLSSIVDSSSSRTVYSYEELNDFMTSLFAPSSIKVKLGADITIPAGKYLTVSYHDVEMDMNGHKIYSNSSKYMLMTNFKRTVKVYNGTFVQNVNNTSGMIDVASGTNTFTKVTLMKASAATNVTGVHVSGINGAAKVVLDKVNINGLTTGIDLSWGGSVEMNNSQIYNTQGDAVKLADRTWLYDSSQDLSFKMTGGSIQYFKGNGIYAGYNTTTVLDGVTITGGTTRNRYGISAQKGSRVTLQGATKVYSNAGGNIGVYNDAASPVKIEGLSNKASYSFTVIDKITDNAPHTVATASFSGKISQYPVYSDISRFMVVSDGNNIQIKNPITECKTTATTEWSGKDLAADDEGNYATVSVNGGAEGAEGSAITKYNKKVTLSTTNLNPDRFEFVGWKKCVSGEVEEQVSTNATIQVDAVDKEATYKAVYRYKTYKLTVKSSGKGSVSVSGATGSGGVYTCYVDDQVTLTATPNASMTDNDGNVTSYGFKKWSDGNTNKTRTITITGDASYTAMFTKTGQTTGTMYVGLKELTCDAKNVPYGKDLLLVYVGKGCENNEMDTSGGASIGVTGLPDGSAKMKRKSYASSDGTPSNSASASNYQEGKANYYGYYKISNLTNATASNTACVQWTVKADDFDTCNPGFIRKETIDGKTRWLYWCNGGGVQAAGPYILYSYDKEVTFNMADVKVTKNNNYGIGKNEQEVDKDSVIVQVKVGDTNYTLGGLKFKADDLDDKINYAEGDKSINFELDGVTVDYDFPEATVENKQYTKLEDAIEDATNGQTINIVGPGVDAISSENPVELKNGVTIKGYDGNTVKAAGGGDSNICIDKDGMVRLVKGELEVNPQGQPKTTVGVKDAFATTDKTIHVKTDANGNAYIVPENDGTNLTISPDNNAEHKVEITGTKKDGNYGFKDLESYNGETVKIGKETEYTVNLPKKEGEDTAPTIKTSKYNTGETVITPGTGSDGNRMPNISSSKEGDKITVGGNTYTTGPIEDGKSTQYRVNPDKDAEPNVILKEGTLGIPEGSTIQVGNKIIKNTGDATGDSKTANTVQVNANGEITIPDGGGVTIDGVEISVPSATPLNGDTTIVLDENGKPHIKTTGNSQVTIKTKEGTFTYNVGDYDSELEIGADGIPVIKNGDILLKPGQMIKDSEGNIYKTPEGASESTTVMTTPKVYGDDNTFIGGGDMSFEIPKNQGIDCKPVGKDEYMSFENPGDTDGFFNLDPAHAADGLQADSELALGAGKSLNINTANGNVTVEAPAGGNQGQIQADGSTGNVTLTKAGDKVIIGGETYETTADDTTLNVNENGVSFVSGGVKVSESGINSGSLTIKTSASDKGSVELVTETSGSDKNQKTLTKIKTNGEDEFVISPIGDADTNVTLIPEGSGDHSYTVNEDGSITLTQGETIKKKNGKTEMSIQAPEGSDITLKPLPKPSKEDVDAGLSIPASGLLVEVPNGNTVTIGQPNEKTYTAVELDRGYTEDKDNKTTIPLDLVLGDDNSVILKSGTVKLGPDADVNLYDSNNKLTTVKNQSEDADKTIQVTNPGIVTAPENGTSVSITQDGKKTEFTSTVDNTQIVYSPDVCALKRGGVDLAKDDKIMIGETVIRNTDNNDSKVSVIREEKKENEPVLDENGEPVKDDQGNPVTREVFSYTSKINVPKGGSFEASYPGSSNSITYESNNKDAEKTTFTVNKDGNIVMPDGGITTINKGSDKEVKIQANGEGIETMPTEDGLLYAIPKGGSIVVNGKKYTNSSDDTLVLSVDKDGKVRLIEGQVELSEGSIVYVENEEKGLVPIANNTEESSEGASQSGPIKVSYKQTTNEQGETTTDYTKVEVEIPTGNDFKIGSNEYSTKTTSGETQEDVKINLDLTKESEETSTPKNDISGSKIDLTEGNVDLKEGSSISVGSGSDKKTVTNVGVPDPSGEASNSIEVKSDATVNLPTNSGMTSKDADGNETTIQVPEKTGDGSDYQAKVDLKKGTGAEGSGSKIGVELKPADSASGSATGSGNQILINGGTYTSKEDDKNLTLDVDAKNNDVSMGAGTSNVGLSNNASVKVGDTTVTAGEDKDKEILVKEMTKPDESGVDTKVPEVDIPGGAEANFKNPDKKQDMTVSVPEKTEGEGSQKNSQTIKVDPDGKLSTDLKKDDKVVIGGIEYTGTSEDETKKNTITVNGETGKLEAGGSGEGAAQPSVSIKLDPEQFNKTGYKYTIPAGSSVSVNGVDYKAPEDGDIELSGNPNGYPIIEIKNAGGTIEIGGKTYTAGNANTKFTVDASGKITLMDNGNSDANSSIKLDGTDSQVVNGVTYRGNSSSDEYTITYNKDGDCSVNPKDGTKLSIDIPKDKTIYVEGKSAVKSKDDKGKDITVSCVELLPIRMTDGNGSVSLDKTVKGATDTAYVSVNGLADVKYEYIGAEDAKNITSITVKAKKADTAQPDTDDKTTGKDNVTIKDNKTGKDIEIPAEIKEDKIVIKDISKATLDKIVSADAEGNRSLTLDCSSVSRNKVEMKTGTMKTLADNADEISIITIGAKITLDRAAVRAIVEQATGNTIEIKVSKEKREKLLNKNQLTAIENYNVKACLDAYVESNGVRITDFKTGVVRVGVPWNIGKGMKAVYYHIYYLAENGKMEHFDTSYEDGKLWFKTSHFSEYVIVYDEDLLNSTPVDQSPLLAECTKVTRNGIRIEWNKVNGAEKYEVYITRCNSNGKKYSLKKVATVDGNTTHYVAQGLKAKTTYKIKVKAVNDKKCIKQSMVLHMATSGGKYTNASDIKASKNKIVLAKGKTTVIKTKFNKNKNTIAHAQPVRYATSNKEVATVNKDGKVTAKHAGTCKVYALLNSGEYVTIQVTVK